MNHALAVVPAWAITPFVAYLLIIALAPLLAGHFWEHNRNKLLVATAISLPVLFFLLKRHPAGGHLLLHTLQEYVGFMALLTALFVVSGGVYVRGSFRGTPFVNSAFLATGALVASLIGTTGASVLLVRPLLRANAARQHARHVVIFFIFVVSNAGGLLTPLGDPPLFLGFLRGVPFTWTFRLFPAWLLLNGMLLGIFFLIDRHLFRREQRARPNLPASGRLGREPLRIEGAVNLVWLAAVPAVVAVLGAYGSRWFGRGALATIVPTLVLGGITVASLATTSAQVHRANAFSWTPIIEVAAVFLGIFVTMIPALGYLQARGGSLGLTEPWQFFWVAGSLSSFLDNAPTYLTFTSVAVGLLNQTAGSNLVATDLGGMAAHPVGGPLLAAISCGSVFMGAVTYIGNGPNFMVKAIAEQTHVRMPGFFGYMLWSGAILLPLFLVLTFVLF